MTQMPIYEVVADDPDHLLIRDVGPWDSHSTITNKAEEVVEALLPVLGGRKLYYIDSEGDHAELVIHQGKFAGFAFPNPETTDGSLHERTTRVREGKEPASGDDRRPGC
jgi:hypothetical protein